MRWRIEFRPEVEHDVAAAAEWYEARQLGLGRDFLDEVFRLWGELVENPLLHARRHPTKNIRWRFPNRFPYRVVYEVVELDHTVIVAAVLHAAQHDRNWQKRIG